MKKLIFSLLVSVVASVTPAQEYKFKVENISESKLVLPDFFGEVTIEGYSGNEVIFSTQNYAKPSERSKGLKPVYANGTDNTGLGLGVVKNGNVVTVNYLLPLARTADFTIKVPSNLAISIKKQCLSGHGIQVSNLSGDIEISACNDILVKDVTGPVVLSSISGNIEVVFSTIRQAKPISISTISGEIDITMPGNTPADIELKTMSGEMFTDFDLTFVEKEKLKYVGGSNLKSIINGGGVSIFVQSISGNIYLRKAK